jgi:hypothetical protein
MSDEGPTPATTIRRVEELLSSVYNDDGIDVWWNARNRNLDGMTPSALLYGTHEDRRRVIAEAERIAGGT